MNPCGCNRFNAKVVMVKPDLFVFMECACGAVWWYREHFNWFHGIET